MSDHENDLTPPDRAETERFTPPESPQDESVIKVPDALSGVVDTVKETIGEVSSTVTDKVKEAVDTMGTVAETVRHTAAGAVEAVQHRGEHSTSESNERTGDDAGSTLPETVSQAASAVANAVDSVTSETEEITPIGEIVDDIQVTEGAALVASEEEDAPSPDQTPSSGEGSPAETTTLEVGDDDDTSSEITEQIQETYNAPPESDDASSTSDDDAQTEASADAPEQAQGVDEGDATQVDAVADASEQSQASETDSTAPSAEEGTPAAAAAGADESAAKRKKPRKRRKRKRRSLDTVKVGEELTGKVRSVQPYGAFVDVGAERDGLIHISELQDGFVEKVEDVVKENDEVTVRVKEVDTERGRLGLTMRSQEAVAEETEQKSRQGLRDISEGDEFTGTVKSIVEFGAFVDIGARTDGLIHISELSEERVNRVQDVVKEGDEVTVRVLSVDRRRNRISLTMREQQEEVESTYTFEDEEDDEPTLSAMELAFARARARERREEREEKSTTPSDNSRELNDIIDRTLAQHTD